MIIHFRIGIYLIIYLLSFTTYSAQDSKNISPASLKKINEYKSLIEKAKAENDTLSQARYYYKLGNLYDYIGYPDSGKNDLLIALKLAKKINNNKAIASISNALATIYSSHGNHLDAINLYQKSYSTFLAIPDSASASDVSINISAEYSEIGDYQKSLAMAFNALHTRLLMKDSTNIAKYYQQIAGIYDMLGNKEKWKAYVMKAYRISKNKKLTSFYTRMGIMNELGAVYLWEKKYDKAEQIYDSIYAKSKRKDYLNGMTTALMNKVALYKKRKNYKKALQVANGALKINKAKNRIYKIIYDTIEIGKINKILGRTVSAEKSLKYGLQLADKYNFPEQKAKIYKELSLIAAQKGKYKSAYLYQINYQTIKDSIANIETKKQILNLEAKYHSVENKMKINSLKNENLLKETKIQTQRRMTIAIIAGGLFLIIILIMLYIQKQLKTKNSILAMEHKLVRTQMNPHFLFNSLIAIQGYVLKNKKLEASNYLSQYAGLMRAILESSRENFITLEEEIKIVKRYVSLQQLRFENSFHFILSVDENLETSSYVIPPMILQPFIENAIEHGLRNIDDEEKFLKVVYKVTGDKLLISVEDNGKGIENNTGVKKHKSLAMQITKERLINITKLFKIKVDLSVVNLASIEQTRGTRVELTFPINKLKRKND